MDIGVLGTGMVGDAVGGGLVKHGYRVMMGARSPLNSTAVDWADAHGINASHGTFADAAAFGEIVFNCTKGAASLAALESAGADNLDGKILVDVANPLDFSHGAPTLTVSNTDSLGEQIQRAFPKVRVVKALNTLNCIVMLDPTRLDGDHDLFICGNDAEAKAEVTKLLGTFGWTTVHDLGDIGAAIQAFVEGQHLSVVREYCGHGIGRAFHEDPQVLHYGTPGTKLRLEPGMTFTIEPMVNAGRREVKLLPDKWTVVTKDHSLSAQWEHTVLVTEDGFEVLTVKPGDNL
jgi:8-hydroxy-5-deazaflavin:NADPH oxidoreductase